MKNFFPGSWIARLLFVSFSLAASAQAQSESCPSAWVPTFGQPPGTEEQVRGMAAWDDGSGEALFLLDIEFTQVLLAPSIPTAVLRKWDGERLSVVHEEPEAGFGLLRVWDDGNGPRLYALGGNTDGSGDWIEGVYRFEGDSWTLVGGSTAWGTSFNLPRTFTATSQGLVLTGELISIGGVSMPHMALWDGTAWTPLGDESIPFPSAVVEFDDGTGMALHIAATYRDSNGQVLSELGRFDGSTFQPVASGAQGRIFDLVVYDEGLGQGPCLFAAGEIRVSGASPPARWVVRWDGASWSALGTPPSSKIRDLEVLDLGQGPELYAGWEELFYVACTVDRDEYEEFAARWDGSSWQSLDGGFATGFGRGVQQLTAVGSGASARLYASGSIEVIEATSMPVEHLAEWDGKQWSALGAAFGGSVDLYATAVFDDGTGDALYVGGRIEGGDHSIGGLDYLCSRGVLAKWDGRAFQPIGGKIQGEIYNLLPIERDGRPGLIVRGLFDEIGGVPCNGIAHWDGATWSPLGSGIYQSHFEIASIELGGEQVLIAQGERPGTGPGTGGFGVFAWDGTDWSRLTPGQPFLWPFKDLHVFDDGSAKTLVAALPSNPYWSAQRAQGAIVFEDGQWKPLGGRVTAPSDYSISTFATFDDGLGPTLFMGGKFTEIEGGAMLHLARWDGQSWQGVGLSDPNYPEFTQVSDLWVHDEGQGLALYVFGGFHPTSTGPYEGAARWDGQRWERLGGFDRFVPFSATSFDVGTGPAMYFAAYWASGADSTSPSTAERGARPLAVWKGCARDSRSFCSAERDESADCGPCPCGNDLPEGAMAGCSNSAGQGALLFTTGQASLAADTLAFELRGAPPSSLALLLSGDNELPLAGACPAAVGAPGLDGLRCVQGGLIRHGSRTSDALGDVGRTTAGWGGVASPTGGLLSASGFAAGQTRHFQVYYRDDANEGCGTGRNTTNGVSVTFR